MPANDTHLIVLTSRFSMLSM